jgi:alkaline phosphatase D
VDDTRARWNIVGQQLLLAELEHLPFEDERYWNDAWDGYPTARRRLLDAVVDERVRNPVVFTGDWHSTFVNDLKLDFRNAAAPTLATEFVIPAITTGGDTPYGPTTARWCRSIHTSSTTRATAAAT